MNEPLTLINSYLQILPVHYNRNLCMGIFVFGLDNLQIHNLDVLATGKEANNCDIRISILNLMSYLNCTKCILQKKDGCLTGHCTHNLKLACSVCYLIINANLKIYLCIFSLRIRTVKMSLCSITQKLLAYLNFDAIFEFLG